MRNAINYLRGFWPRLFTVFHDPMGKHGIAIVAIAKNESEYIREWVAFHKAVGFDRIILYDNDSTDNMRVA